MRLLYVAINIRWHNDNKLFIMYCKWLSLPDICMYVWHLMLHLTWLDIWLCYWLTIPAWYIDYDGHLIPDCILDLIHILLCAIHITIYLLYSCYFLFQYVYFLICSHVICLCTFQFILIHSLGVLTPWICISRSVAIYCWSGIWRGSHASWEVGVPLFLIIGIHALLFMLFPDSTYIMSSCHFFPLLIWPRVKKKFF